MKHLDNINIVSILDSVHTKGRYSKGLRWALGRQA